MDISVKKLLSLADQELSDWDIRSSESDFIFTIDLNEFNLVVLICVSPKDRIFRNLYFPIILSEISLQMATQVAEKYTAIKIRRILELQKSNHSDFLFGPLLLIHHEKMSQKSNFSRFMSLRIETFLLPISLKSSAQLFFSKQLDIQNELAFMNFSDNYSFEIQSDKFDGARYLSLPMKVITDVDWNNFKNHQKSRRSIHPIRYLKPAINIYDSSVDPNNPLHNDLQSHRLWILETLCPLGAIVKIRDFDRPLSKLISSDFNSRSIDSLIESRLRKESYFDFQPKIEL